ncbi:general transcription factor IIH subunit 4-like isoform X2 [Tubulanus polymorphus]|uniref:general transcription factor IIH subunit 4-like isoform X2 n=1 Tax=Tubulanus polymorphus TaxID=672921 RepID=UPI003DA33C34
MSSISNKTTIVCKNLHEYLTQLPDTVLDRLYNNPATCLAVIRQLPVLGQHFVMRLLFVDQAVPQAIVSSWILNSCDKKYNETSKILKDLKVLQEEVIPGGLRGWILNSTFKSNFKIALLGGGNVWPGSGTAQGADKHSKDVTFLDNYAMERWECVLNFMVGSKETTQGMSRDIVEILLFAGLMKVDDSGGIPRITPSGFQFLLMENSSQIWYFMLQYLETVESRGMDLVECLSFLFQLSFSSLGNRKSQRYYPTRLAINLTSGMSQVSTQTARPGFIVVETNYRIYAYTNSPLQVALIGLFADLIYRFPNMCVANVTRESVRQALIMGITAQQIINFLRSHAHPQTLNQIPVIPPTITDQIRLWELERDRFRFNDGVLYNQFNSIQDFELLRNYAKDLGVLVWENPIKRAMVVTKGSHDEVRKFWKRQRPQTT